MALEFNRLNNLYLEGNLSEYFKAFKEETELYLKALLNFMGRNGLKLYSIIKRVGKEMVDIILKSLEEYCTPKIN